MNGKYILKSGTDFRQFSVVTLKFGEGKATAEIEAVEVTKDFEPNNELKTQLEKYTGELETCLQILSCFKPPMFFSLPAEKMDSELIKELGEFECDLDGRFSTIRTSETNLGNFVCDIMVAATNAHFALLNSGTLRSDCIHPAGPFFLKDLLNVLPMIDQLVLLEVTGKLSPFLI